MLEVLLRILEDIPPTLLSLITPYYSYALHVRDIAEDTVKEQITYIIRLFRSFALPNSSERLVRLISPASLGAYLRVYATQYGPSSLRWMQTSLRVFLFLYPNSFIDRDLSVWVPVRRVRRLERGPRSLPDEVIVSLRNGIISQHNSGYVTRYIN